MLYKRVENHWRQTPEYRELEIRWVPEGVTRLATLLEEVNGRRIVRYGVPAAGSQPEPEWDWWASDVVLDAGDGTDAASMTFVATVAEANAAMAGMAYEPNAHFAGAAAGIFPSRSGSRP